MRVSIPHAAAVGPGLFIGHFGGIVVNERATIGCNCNLSHGVTIGQTNRGPRKGCPTIGDGVFLGPGCTIIGMVSVGHNAVVGANAVVTKDIAENEVVGGVPARRLSDAGNAGYVDWTDYDK
jgi:serine O-acetyltransferase